MLKNQVRMEVLVTGADGFIGSHLTEMLLEKGYRVKALAYYNSFNDLGMAGRYTTPSVGSSNGRHQRSSLL